MLPKANDPRGTRRKVIMPHPPCRLKFKGNDRKLTLAQMKPAFEKPSGVSQAGVSQILPHR
jgi:hypothetical protein